GSALLTTLQSSASRALRIRSGALASASRDTRTCFGPCHSGFVMLFEQIRTGGCLSYLIGCDDSCAAMLVDPHLDQHDRYLALVPERGMRIHYVIETHTHADHFSAARELARRLDARVVMHRLSAAPYADIRVDDGETLIVGKLRIGIMTTPGHTD